MAPTWNDLHDDILRLIVDAVVALPKNRTLPTPDDPKLVSLDKQILRRPIGAFSQVNKLIRGLCVKALLREARICPVETIKSIAAILSIPGANQHIRALLLPVSNPIPFDNTFPTEASLKMLQKLSDLQELHLNTRNAYWQGVTEFVSLVDHRRLALQTVQTLHFNVYNSRGILLKACPNVKNLCYTARFDESPAIREQEAAICQHFPHLQHIEVRRNFHFVGSYRRWSFGQLLKLIRNLPCVPIITIVGELDNIRLSSCAIMFARIRGLKHITIPGWQTWPDHDIWPDLEFEWDSQLKHAAYEDDDVIRQAFFAACPSLETLCIQRNLRGWSRIGRILTRNQKEPSHRPRLLPAHFALHAAPTNDKGQLLIGVPDSIDLHVRDDEDDGIFYREHLPELEAAYTERYLEELSAATIPGYSRSR